MRLLMNRRFTLSVLAVVVVATVLAFVFGASQELIGAVLALGVVTALLESRMSARK